MADESCPKCGQAREPQAVDCPWCGIVYARWKAGPTPGLVTPGPQQAGRTRSEGARSRGEGAAGAGGGELADPSPEHAGAGDLYQPPADLYDPGPTPEAGRRGSRVDPRRSSPRAEGSPDGVEHFDTPFTRSLPLSLVVAGLLYLLVQTYFVQNVFNWGDGVAQARAQFERLTGFEPPPGLDDVSSLTFAGRQIVALEATEDEAERARQVASGRRELAVSAWAVHYGPLAGRPSHEELLALVDSRVELLRLPFHVVSDRAYRLRGQPARVRVLALGPGGRELARVFSIAATAPDGRPVLMVIAGPTVRVTTLMRRHLLGLERM